MRVSKFTDGQIVAALRQAEAGTPVADVCRKHGITVSVRLGRVDAVSAIA